MIYRSFIADNTSNCHRGYISHWKPPRTLQHTVYIIYNIIHSPPSYIILQRAAMLRIVLAIAFLSVCPSHAGIVSK